MDEKVPQSETLFPHETGHHRSARERQRRGPMFGCLRAMVRIFVFGTLLLLIVLFAIPWIVTTANFEDYVRKRVEATLKARLGRDIWIKEVEVVRAGLFNPTKVILHDLRIANAPGAATRYFATVREVEITGGIDSFRRRSVRVARIYVRDPRVNFEVFPIGGPYTHNFPRWKSGPRSRYEIVRIDMNEMFVTGGAFVFLDRRHNMTIDAGSISSQMKITRAEGLYEGLMTSPRLRVRIQEYEPFETDLRGGFRYTPGVLALNSIALRGRGIEAFVSGRLEPLTEGVYNLRVTSKLELARVREIFRLERLLEGQISLDTNLSGRQADFAMTGGWVSPRIAADTYELGDAKGTLNVTENNAVIDVERARYGGGSIGAHYTLARYGEPYPMNVDLRYNGISVEQLFSDWGIENTGLRGAATGTLTYRWNKDKLLDGAGSGSARLSKSATAFSRAKYPIPIAGSTDFALNRGVITFRRAELDTDASHVSLTGTLGIDDVITNFRVAIRSTDFSELDRVAFNFARSAGKRDFDLLGLGGAGTITGTVRGALKTATVAAHISSTGTKYNNVVLGDGEIDLRYDGPRSVLTFERAVFVDGRARLTLTGTVAFPDRGPSPLFDLAIDATSYSVERAVAALGLDFKVGSGLGTGRMIVTGSPESGKVTFANMIIRRADAELRLAGDVTWRPGEGNVLFNLDITARDFPVADIVAFLDLGALPVTGDLTGTLHIEGPKKALEGSGTVTVRRGTIFGEPVDVATANISFEQGRMRATNLSVTSPAGQITGEAEFDLATERFSYTIQTSTIDLSRLKILDALRGLLGGRVTITSTGAGTMDQPELVLEATLDDATVRGLALPPGTVPKFYFAIRNGQLIVRGSIGDILSIEGNGTVGTELAVTGNVRITINDIARLATLSPTTATLPASGNAVIDLTLGGRLSPMEALQIDGTVPTMNLRVSEHEFKPVEPLRFSLRDGRVNFDSFRLQRDGSGFTVAGFAEITGAKRLGVDVDGAIEAALLQLFLPDMRAEGHVNLDVDVRGTLAAPAVTGTAELQHAEVRFEGFPQLIDDINGTLRFGGEGVEIDSIRATVGGGTVVAGGSILLDGLRPRRASVSLRGTGVALRYFEGVTIEGNFDLQVSGDADGAVVAGNVDVTRAHYFKDFDLQQSILNIILTRGGITPAVAASWQDRVNLSIHLSATEDDVLAVRNNIADVTGTAELDLTGTLANPVILGTIDLNEGGTVTFQNIEYRVERGTINFSNPYRIDPYFDVTLEGRVSGGISEVESGPIDLTVNLTGTLDRMTPTITSDPPASDITLFSLLGFGALTRQNGVAEGTSATLVGQSLLLSSLTSAIGSRILPFADSFAFDPGLLDTGTGGDPKVTFEKRVSNNIRLLVVYNMTSHESREVVQWTINRDWTLQVTRDETSNEFRAEGRFRRRYHGRWSWGRGRQDIFDVGSVADALGEGTTVAVAPAPRTTPVAALDIAAEARVAQINFRADGRFDTSTLTNYVTMKVGDPLTIREVQSSVKALFATGNFRDVRVDATPLTGEVVLTFALYLNYRIGKIDFAGVGGRDRRRAEEELTIRMGEVLSLNAVDDDAGAIQEELSRNGFLEATVDPETTFVREHNVANVTFHVNLGPLARVGSVQVEGDLQPFSYQELLRTMHEQPGKVFRLGEAREDANRIKNFLIRREHRRADVDFAGHTYDPSSKTVALRYTANVGPIVKVEVEGIERSAVRRQLPFRSRNQEYSEDAVERAADDMVRSLQQRGHFYATVDVDSGLENGTWVTRFKVKPGQRYRLADVTFSGNTKIPDKELEELIQVSPRGGFRRLLATLFRRPAGVTRAQLSDDRDALESHYRLQGFSEAAVGTAAVTGRADGTMIVDFPIVEGPQTLVASVKVEGAEQVDLDDLPELLVKPGEPLNPQLEREDVVRLQSFYGERGNTEVQITPRTAVSPDKTTADVTYVIAEGTEVSVGEIIVRGNTYTNGEVVLRKSDLDPGDPFSYTSILEAQRNLYRLGIFQRVDIQPEQTGTTVADRNVVIDVEEGRNLTVSGSVGARSTADENILLRIAGGIAHRNLFGTGRYLGLEAVSAGTEEQEFFLTYREPFIGRYDVPVQLTFFQTKDNTVKERRYQQRGVSIEASKVTRMTTRWSLQYQYKISDCVAGELCTEFTDIFVPGLDPSLLDIQIASVTPTFFWDRRDDVFNPTRGFFASASVEYAFPAFDAPTKFLKEFVQGAWYIPISRRSVLALSGRVGLIQPMMGDDATTLEDESFFVPVAERFTAGGDTSHRAYPQDLMGTVCFDLIGPNREDRVPIGDPGCRATLVDLDPGVGAFRVAPIGGNGILMANAEYRFPIFATLGGAVFADVGNIYARTISFSELRWGVGGGLRYLSPVGPIRIDVGFPLNREPWDRAFAWSITLGYAF
jgi:outer membrane protein insertion porin family